MYHGAGEARKNFDTLLIEIVDNRTRMEKFNTNFDEVYNKVEEIDQYQS